MNTAQFAGMVGNDGKLAYTESGTARLNFSLAVAVYNRGEKETTWVQCSMFGKRAESVAPYVKKGTSLAVGGEVGIWNRNDGGATLTLNVWSLTLLGGKTGGQSEGGQGHNEPQPQRRPPRDNFADFDDDIPF